MRMYIGKVTKVDSDKIYLINFIIPKIYDDKDNPLTAVPLCRLFKNPEVDDEIIVIKPEDGINIYYYILSYDNPNSITIQYDTKNSITFNKNSDKIKLDINCDGDITINSSGNININSGKSKDILLNNHLKVQV